MVKFVIHLLRCPQSLWMCWLLREQIQLLIQLLSEGYESWPDPLWLRSKGPLPVERHSKTQGRVVALFLELLRSVICFTVWIIMSVYRSIVVLDAIFPSFCSFYKCSTSPRSFISTDGKCYVCNSHHYQGDTCLSIFVFRHQFITFLEAGKLWNCTALNSHCSSSSICHGWFNTQQSGGTARNSLQVLGNNYCTHTHSCLLL